MFEQGEYIVYGSTGVCKVEKVTTMDMDGVPGDKLYYILRPYHKEDREIFTPVDNKKTKMRKLLSSMRSNLISTNLMNWKILRLRKKNSEKIIINSVSEAVILENF